MDIQACFTKLHKAEELNAFLKRQFPRRERALLRYLPDFVNNLGKVEGAQFTALSTHLARVYRSKEQQVIALFMNLVEKLEDADPFPLILQAAKLKRWYPEQRAEILKTYVETVCAENLDDSRVVQLALAMAKGSHIDKPFLAQFCCTYGQKPAFLEAVEKNSRPVHRLLRILCTEGTDRKRVREIVDHRLSKDPSFAWELANQLGLEEALEFVSIEQVREHRPESATLIYRDGHVQLGGHCYGKPGRDYSYHPRFDGDQGLSTCHFVTEHKDYPLVDVLPFLPNDECRSKQVTRFLRTAFDQVYFLKKGARSNGHYLTGQFLNAMIGVRKKYPDLYLHAFKAFLHDYDRDIDPAQHKTTDAECCIKTLEMLAPFEFSAETHLPKIASLLDHQTADRTLLMR